MHDLTLQNKTMSSTQLLEIMHFSSKSTLNRAIKDMFHDKIDGAVIASSLDSRGYVIEYNLPEKESKMFVAKHDIDYLEQVIQFWINKESKPELPQNFAQALRLAADQQEEIEEKKLQIEQKNQLILASNEASIKAGEILVSEFCKSVDIIDIGSTKFYQWMREQGLVFKHSREPMQKYRDRGFFTWKPTEEQHGGKFRYTLRITPRGKVWLAAKYMQFLDNELAVA